MKALLILVLASFSAYAGYKFAYDELAKVVDLSPSLEKPAEQPAPVVAKVTPTVIAKTIAPAPEPPKPTEQPKPMAATEAPKVATDGGLGMTANDPDGFVPPKFQTIEEITKNWKEIPQSVFTNHLPVNISKEVEFKIGAGTLKMKAGGQAFAVGQAGDMLVIAPAKDSPGRAEIAIADTDIKAVISSVYDKWKVAQFAYLKRQFLSHKSGPDKELASKTKAKPLGANTKPSRNPDGSYAVLLESMKSGQVREITPQNIKKWSEVTQETIDGKEYWTVLVNYTTKTMFGDFDVEAQARIFGGKVDKWVYTGSGEVVP